MKRVLNRVCVVTGAASGIGRAVTARLLGEGATVLGIDYNREGLVEIAAVTVEAGIGEQYAFAALDITDEGAVEDAITSLAADRSRIDGLVNAAGVAGPGDALEIDRDHWSKIIEVNLTGTGIACRAALRQMTRQKSGSIVNIASVGSLVASPGNAAYLAAKGGVAALTKSIAVDFGPQNIRANAICPGTVPTPLVERYYSEGSGALSDRISAAARRYPLQRIGDVDEVAALALYMICDESGFMTGSIVPIDGGVSAAAWLVGQ